MYLFWLLLKASYFSLIITAHRKQKKLTTPCNTSTVCIFKTDCGSLLSAHGESLLSKVESERNKPLVTSELQFSLDNSQQLPWPSNHEDCSNFTLKAEDSMVFSRASCTNEQSRSKSDSLKL